MKAAILETTTDVLEGSADVAKKVASVTVDSAMVVKDAAIRGYEAAGDAVKFTGKQIRRNPLAAALSAIGAGFLIGFLIGRKTKA